jgi:beta-mannosidase
VIDPVDALPGAVLVACEPDSMLEPGGLTPQVLAGALSMVAPGTVATVAGWESLLGPGQAVDDLDWWLVADVDHASPVRITFDGLTFPATVFVDGDAVAVVESMFLPVVATVPAGRHRVAIRFGSLTRWLATRRPRGRWRSSLVSAQGLRWARTTLLGRAPVYGGAPAPVGVWRGVRVASGAVIDDVEIRADVVSSAAGRVTVRGLLQEVSGSSSTDDAVRLVLRGPDGRVLTEETVRGDAAGHFSATVDVTDPALWWPRGYGDQPLYRLTLAVGDATVERVVGFRTLDVDRSDGGFVVRVDDVPVFCRGAVWTPSDPTALGSPAAAERSDAMTRHRLALLAEAGATMVRIPGGLAFEGAEFWDAAAELGLLVWQDAMVATVDPPAELDDLVARETAHAVRSVSGNPAIAVVSGGSETVQQPVMLGLPADRRRMTLLDEVLPAVAADAGVPFVESSPSAPAGSDDFPLRADSGISHWFGVGGYRRPIRDVATAGVRFAAECLAFAIPPTTGAVERHFGSAAVVGHHPDWKAGVPRDRGAAWDFEDVRDVYVAEVFDVDPAAVRARDPERYLQLGRLAIAAAMSECFAHWRLDASCGGALVLAAADPVPGAGWGLIDSDGGAKLPLAVLARAWAPVALFVRDAGTDGVAVHVVNDRADPVAGELRLTATTDGGATVVEGVRTVEVPPRGSIMLLDSEITGVFRDLSDAYRFGARTADAVEVELIAGDRRICRDVLCVRPGHPTVSGGTRATARRVDEGWELEIAAPVALRWTEIDAPGWLPADDVVHIAGGRPLRIRLEGEGGGAPRGQIRSPDLATPVRIEVEG